MAQLKETITLTINEGANTADILQLAEAKLMEHIYKECRYNQSKAAIALGMSRGCFRTKMETYFLDKYIGGKE